MSPTAAIRVGEVGLMGNVVWWTEDCVAVGGSVVGYSRADDPMIDQMTLAVA